MQKLKNGKIRISFFILSLFINSLGVVLITKSALGTSSISTLPFVLSLYFPLSFGALTFLMNVAFIFLQYALLGKKGFPPIQWCQFLINIIFSPAIDFWMYVFADLVNPSLPLGLLCVVLGSMILAFGICLEVACQLLLAPGEGIVKAIATVIGWRLGSTKNAFDASLVVISCLLSNILGGLGTFTGLGLGTLLSAVLVGRFVNFFNSRLPFLHKLYTLKDTD